MNNPENLVKNFIEDYFQWNKQSFEQADKINQTEKSALLTLGISQPNDHIEESKMLEFVKIKGQTSVEYMKLLSMVSSEYQKLIDRYCRQNYKSLNSSFGSESSHSPENEIIVSIQTIGENSIVKTQNTDRSQSGEFISDYEFHLSYENERWYLEQIFYVNDEGKYESL